MTSRHLLGLLASVALATSTLAGCGNEVTTGSGGSAGAGSGGAGPGGSGGSGASCESFAPPDVIVQPVKVRLSNKTTADLYLGELQPSCDANLGFTLEKGDHQPLMPSRDICSFTCGQLQHSSCACAADCAAPTVTLVAPGGVHEVVWAGTVFSSEKMPAACFQDATCAASPCLVESAPPSETLTLLSSAWSQPKGCTPPDCTCTPDATGTCIVPGAFSVGGTETKATAAFNPGETQVDIVFQ